MQHGVSFNSRIRFFCISTLITSSKELFSTYAFSCTKLHQNHALPHNYSITLQTGSMVAGVLCRTEAYTRR